jgi:hypothetical protein
VRNSDVAGVHNENDFNMLTPVAERTIPAIFQTRALSRPLSDVNREAPSVHSFPVVACVPEIHTKAGKQA